MTQQPAQKLSGVYPWFSIKLIILNSAVLGKKKSKLRREVALADFEDYVSF